MESEFFLMGSRSLLSASQSMLRYGLASVGPVGAAVSQFLLSIVLLHSLDSAAFGSFAFLLVTSQFSSGVWSALFCAPLPVLVAAEADGMKLAVVDCMLVSNLIFSILAGLVFLLLALSLGVPHLSAGLFAVYGSVALVRWFGRSFAYVAGTPLRTVSSDLLYSVVLFVGVIALHAVVPRPTYEPYALLLFSAGLGLIPFGGSFLHRQFLTMSWSALRQYIDVWRQHSSWSLIGVVTTEATANAHAYLVTLFVGPAAFAPISASSLLIRPINVIVNALSDFERPQMAKQLGLGRLSNAVRAARTLKFILIATWIAAALCAWIIVTVSPTIIFPAKYDLRYLIQGVVVWMAVAGIRLLRVPESVLLQSAGQFKPLAYASLISSFVSVGCVAVLLYEFGPLWSIFGILIGEFIYALWVWRQARRWLHAKHVTDAHAAPAFELAALSSSSQP